MHCSIDFFLESDEEADRDFVGPKIVGPGSKVAGWQDVGENKDDVGTLDSLGGGNEDTGGSQDAGGSALERGSSGRGGGAADDLLS